MVNRTLRIFIFVQASLLLTACAAPTEVRELTVATGANVQTLTASIKKFDKGVSKVEKQLAAKVDKLELATVNKKLVLQKVTAVNQLANAKGKLRFVDTVVQLADVHTLQLEAHTRQAAVARQKVTLDKLDKTKASNKDLSEIQSKLGKLVSSDKLFKHRLKQFAIFAKAATNSVKALSGAAQ